MPVFELVDFTDLSQFIIEYDHYESIATPDISGTRVENYMNLTRFCSQLKYFDRAFPSPNDKKGRKHLSAHVITNL